MITEEQPRKGNVLWILPICIVLAVWALLPLMCHWCISPAAAQSGWGTPADMCDLDDADCSMLAEMDLWQYEAGMWSTRSVGTVMAEYARLDGATTTGPWEFGDQVRSLTSVGCTIPTEISLTAPPVTIGGTTYSFAPGDPPPDGCGDCGVGGLLALVSGGALTGAQWSCCNDQTQVHDAPVLTALLHANDLALCAISAPSFGVHLSVLSPNDCADVRTTLQAAFGNPDPPLVLDASDPHFYAWNATTCTWDLDLEPGWSVYTTNCGEDCGGASFPASPTITSDSVPVSAWSIDTTGNAYFAGSVRIDGSMGVKTGPTDNIGFRIDLDRSGAPHTGDPPLFGLVFQATGRPTQDSPVGQIAGVYGLASAVSSSHIFGQLAALAGIAAYDGASGGTLAKSYGLKGDIYNFGGGDALDAFGSYSGFQVHADGGFERVAYYGGSPYADIFQGGSTGKIVDATFLDVPDITGPRITGSATAIRVATQTDPSLGYAADWGWETRHRDDIRAYFGDDEDFALYYDSTEAALVLEGSDPFFLQADLKTDRWQGWNTNTFLGRFQMADGNMEAGAVNNTFVGHRNAQPLTTGYQNSVFGSDAGKSLTTGYLNAIVGYNAGNLLSTGYNNVILGGSAGSRMTTGRRNVLVGYNAFRADSLGVAGGSEYNVAVGHAAGDNKEEQSDANTFLGAFAGRYHGDGSTALKKAMRSVYLGSYAYGYSDADDNAIVIGYQAKGQGANTTVIGNASTVRTYLKGSQVYTVEDVTCENGTNTCAYNANVVTTRLTSDDDADGADVVTVTDGVDGQRRTFILAVDGGDDVTIDVSSNGNGTDTTLTAAGESVTYEYDAVTDTWQIVSKNP